MQDRYHALKLHLILLFSELRKFVKIAEGVYGEVFKFKKDGEVTIIKVTILQTFSASK